MKAVKQDRRSRRTRQLLTGALVELMLEKQFDAITVEDILTRADVGRSTFYGHYMGKEDLLFNSLEDMLHGLANHPSDNLDSAGMLLPSLQLFRHVQQHKQLYKAFTWARGADLFARKFQSQLSALVEQNLALMMADNASTKIPLPALANFVAGSFLILLRWWLESNNAYSPEQIDEMFQQMVQPGVAAALHNDH